MATLHYLPVHLTPRPRKSPTVVTNSSVKRRLSSSLGGLLHEVPGGGGAEHVPEGRRTDGDHQGKAGGEAADDPEAEVVRPEAQLRGGRQGGRQPEAGQPGRGRRGHHLDAGHVRQGDQGIEGQKFRAGSVATLIT